jgi:hypothetical protein
MFDIIAPYFYAEMQTGKNSRNHIEVESALRPKTEK